MLAVEGLHAHYGRAHILADLGFRLAPGEVLALVGRNGAGKSTTLKCLIGLVRPSRGRVLLDGRDVAGWPPHRIAAAGIGYVPEDRRVFADLTVLENLEVGKRAPHAGEPWTPARLFTLFPALEPLARRPAGYMSGGEQQMLTIARTLMGNPRLVLLDEPSEGLAPRVVAEMADAVREMKQAGLAVLLSEQNLNFANAVADHALVLEKGRIRFTGKMADLLADEGVRQAYLSV